ncbi:MAG: PDZ domain-containing protein [Clostridia bacterium]|nr:PDZ domain-containing protein [Clostridia bacterium]
MKQNNKKTVLSLILVTILTITCFVGAYAEEVVKPSAYQASLMKNSIANLCIQIADNYYYGVTDEDLLYRALCSAIDEGKFDFDKAVEKIVGLLKDGYSEFYTSERFESFYTDITGEFYGIGVQIMLSGDHVVVASVFPGSPAEKSGILPYDTIVSVDGKDISGLSVNDVATLIKREKGARVQIGVIRNGLPRTIDCFCDEVSQSPISYEILEDGKIGYIYLSTFSLTLDEFIDPVLKEFEEKGIKKIILDIRNNGGGELTAAIELAKRFVPEGTIAKLKYKNPEKNEDVTIANGLKNAPYEMVLLVNGYSASASELFAGAVKDRKAGTIIGTNTYGKGSMQSVFRLITGCGVKYTVAEFHSPNDTRIHTVGVAPDFAVENTVHKITEEDLEPMVFSNEKENDTKLNLAIEQRLEALGCFHNEPDEVFDEETGEALKYFQMLKNLEITGEADIYTLVALNDIIYEYEYTDDDQLEAAKAYLLTGKIN